MERRPSPSKKGKVTLSKSKSSCLSKFWRKQKLLEIDRSKSKKGHRYLKVGVVREHFAWNGQFYIIYAIN